MALNVALSAALVVSSLVLSAVGIKNNMPHSKAPEVVRIMPVPPICNANVWLNRGPVTNERHRELLASFIKSGRCRAAIVN